MSISAYVERFPARWHVTRAETALEWKQPRSIGRRVLDLESQLPARSTELGVLELEEGSVFGSHGWVVGADGLVLPELSWYGQPNERIVIPQIPSAPLQLEGVCLSIVSDWSCRNYAHFLLDALGRLAVLADAGIPLADVDHVYCPTPPSPAAAPLLERFGLPSDRIVSAEPGRLVRADTLLVPSRPAAGLTYPSWLTEFLRRLLPGVPAGPSRRLYVSRRGFTRRAVRETELEALLVDHGFEIYVPHEHEGQPDDFAGAEFVVGEHGAGLANLAFCRSGTRVIEIIPSDNAHPFYYSLGVAGGLDYAYLAGDSPLDRGPDGFGPSPDDFEVDLAALEAELEQRS